MVYSSECAKSRGLRGNLGHADAWAARANAPRGPRGPNASLSGSEFNIPHTRLLGHMLFPPYRSLLKVMKEFVWQ